MVSAQDRCACHAVQWRVARLDLTLGSCNAPRRWPAVGSRSWLRRRCERTRRSDRRVGGWLLLLLGCVRHKTRRRRSLHRSSKLLASRREQLEALCDSGHLNIDRRPGEPTVTVEFGPQQRTNGCRVALFCYRWRWPRRGSRQRHRYLEAAVGNWRLGRRPGHAVAKCFADEGFKRLRLLFIASAASVLHMHEDLVLRRHLDRLRAPWTSRGRCEVQRGCCCAAADEEDCTQAE